MTVSTCGLIPGIRRLADDGLPVALGPSHRAPNAQVRRKYRRAVLRSAKEAPPQCASPQEIETRAGLEDSQLHRLYEKARYSQEGCTSQESRSLKR